MRQEDTLRARWLNLTPLEVRSRPYTESDSAVSAKVYCVSGSEVLPWNSLTALTGRSQLQFTGETTETQKGSLMCPAPYC